MEILILDIEGHSNKEPSVLITVGLHLFEKLYNNTALVQKLWIWINLDYQQQSKEIQLSKIITKCLILTLGTLGKSIYYRGKL